MCSIFLYIRMSSSVYKSSVNGQKGFQSSSTLPHFSGKPLLILLFMWEHRSSVAVLSFMLYHLTALNSFFCHHQTVMVSKLCILILLDSIVVKYLELVSGHLFLHWTLAPFFCTGHLLIPGQIPWSGPSSPLGHISNLCWT